mmetsp:Transcript_1576/g.4879  ORF Transcript_1576/g.4879 Transcript_1576/m.4879 type:complete len:390 (+) Transcript_1576:109-1278(+)
MSVQASPPLEFDMRQWWMQQKSPSLFDLLPDALIVHIFSYTSSRERYGTLSGVCWRFRRICLGNPHEVDVDVMRPGRARTLTTAEFTALVPHPIVVSRFAATNCSNVGANELNLVLSRCIGITELSLIGNTNVGPTLFNPPLESRSLSCLTQVSLAGCRNVGDSSVARLVAHAPNLTRLVLAGVRLSHASTFSVITNSLLSLQHLDISQTSLENSGWYEVPGVNIVPPSLDVASLAARKEYAALRTAVCEKGAFPGVIPTGENDVPALVSVMRHGDPMSPKAPVLREVLDMFKILVENGHPTNMSGCSTLLFAVRKERPDLVRLLLDHGAFPDDPQALIVALGKGDHASVRWLLQAGVSIPAAALDAARSGPMAELVAATARSFPQRLV